MVKIEHIITNSNKRKQNVIQHNTTQHNTKKKTQHNAKKKTQRNKTYHTKN